MIRKLIFFGLLVPLVGCATPMQKAAKTGSDVLLR